jgi:hypothetical protein
MSADLYTIQPGKLSSLKEGINCTTLAPDLVANVLMQMVYKHFSYPSSQCHAVLGDLSTHYIVWQASWLGLLLSASVIPAETLTGAVL